MELIKTERLLLRTEGALENDRINVDATTMISRTQGVCAKSFFKSAKYSTAHARASRLGQPFETWGEVA